MRRTPFRFKTLHFSHIGFTDARTFMATPVSPGPTPGAAGRYLYR